MQFTAAAVLAFAASALAQTLHFDAITKPGQSETIPAGETYTINWEPSTEYEGTVTLSVLGGADPGTLQPVAIIAKNVVNSLGTYDWAVPSSLGSLATYGIQITLDTNTSILQYSFPFTISGGSNGTASSASASATASGAASSGSSAASTTSEAPSSASTAVPIGNLSTTATDLPKTTVTSVFTQTPSTVASKTSSVATIPTNAAAPLAVGPLALFGALAAAVFAL